MTTNETPAPTIAEARAAILRAATESGRLGQYDRVRGVVARAFAVTEPEGGILRFRRGGPGALALADAAASAVVADLVGRHGLRLEHVQVLQSQADGIYA